jgi:hypothetical protein
MLFAQIDSAYVVLPKIAKKNNAGDKPSHRVLKFFTRFKVQCERNRVNTQRGNSNIFAARGRPAGHGDELDNRKATSGLCTYEKQGARPS